MIQVNQLPTRLDLHIHTCYSQDCATTLQEVVSYSKEKGLSGIAITDHNTVEGALRLLKEKNTGLLIIPGIEVSTARGHILGFNVTTPIPPRLSIGETADSIHEAGGIAVVAHPFALFKSGLGLEKKIACSGLDAAEVINSSVLPFSLSTYLNRRFANSVGLPQTAGSDSHMPESIGLAYTIIEDVESEPTVEGLIQAVKRGVTVPFGRPTPWRLRLRRVMRRKR